MVPLNCDFGQLGIVDSMESREELQLKPKSDIP